jgi:hypothetical protein
MTWNSEPEWKLARIEKTLLGYEDHGLLTFLLSLAYGDPESKLGGSGQGFGHYSLGGAYTDWAIRGILKSVGVGMWEQIEGNYVWALAEHTKVHAIRGVHTAVEFNPKDGPKEESAA